MPARSRTALFQLPRIAKPSGTSSLGPSPSRSAWFQLPRIAKPSGTSPAISPARSSPLFQLPRIAKPSGTSATLGGAALAFTGFQLPRIAKPSGTSPLRCSFGWWQITSFQLPRIAKPSGTPLAAGTARRLLGHVSTSPDSKAIRNRQAPCRCCLFLRVSTSPDSKAIRNLGSIATGWPGGFSRFQLPRIAKPSGTMDKISELLRLPDLVSTSPDSKAIRNRALERPCTVRGLKGKSAQPLPRPAQPPGQAPPIR